ETATRRGGRSGHQPKAPQPKKADELCRRQLNDAGLKPCPATAANTCTRSDLLSSGASYASITVTPNNAVNAPSPLTNQASVSAGGSSPATWSDSARIIQISGDFGGNRMPDILLQFPDGSMGVWYLGGTGRQLPITAFAFLAGPSMGIKLVDVADLN